MKHLFLDPERRKLILSLFANMMTRFPGIALVFLILPRLFAGLGPERYAALFAALALGTLASFPMTGTGVLGVRLIGSAASQDDRTGAASAFLSLGAANFSLSAFLMATVFAIELARGHGLTIACIALLPLFQAAFNVTFDNARLSYNEHYWTASLALSFQILWYILVLTTPAFHTHILLAATVFHAPTILASLTNGVLLLRSRPYLVRGRITHFRAMLRAGFSFGTADGLLMAALGLVVIWLQISAPPAVTSWVATQNRLFSMCFTPILMVLVPLGGFIRVKWAGATPKRQRDAIKAAFIAGILAFFAMAVGLGVAGPLYARHWLGLEAPAGWLILAPCFLYFGTIAFYRCFASIAYLVLDGAWLAHHVIAACLAAGLAWIAAAHFLDPLAGFAVFATIASLSVIVAVSLSARRTLAMAPSHTDTTNILGTPITITDHDRAAARVLGWIRERQSRYVCVRDVHGIMLAQRDAGLMEIHQAADMILPDGMPLVHIARWRGHRSIRRVSGPDFVETLADLGRAEGVRHYFYGGKPGIADAMAAALARRYPGLAIAGASVPPFGEVSENLRRAEMATIMAAAPDIVWVGLSTPKQERWMRRHRGELAGVTLIGVGAAFDFHAGAVKRAPRWMQRATLEWLHRLLSEPTRLWRRYLVLAPQFVWHMLWDRAA